MDFSVFTFNTLFGNGQKALKKLFEINKPDIVCLQEINTSKSSLLEVEKLGYTLSEYSNTFIKNGTIYGVATFFNQQKFKHISSQHIFLPTGFFDILVAVLRIFHSGRKQRTVLKSEFRHLETNNLFYITNVHLSPWGSNSIRLKQLKKTIHKIGKTFNKSVIVTGDFNYPYGRKKLEECMNEFDFKEATNTILSTVYKLSAYNTIEKILAFFQNIIFRKGAKFDYMFYKNCSVISSHTLNSTFSDHLPILTYFKFNK